MSDVLRALGVNEFRAKCLLVGVKISNQRNPNGVFVMTEHGQWPIEIFDGLHNRIEEQIKENRCQEILYTNDEQATLDQPENIRRDSSRVAVQQAMTAYDSEHDVQSFAGRPASVQDHYIIPVLQLPAALFRRFRPLQERATITDGFEPGQPSLIHAAVSKVLGKARGELHLLQLNPRRKPNLDSQSFRERQIPVIIQAAAVSFMNTIWIAAGDEFVQYNLFHEINEISLLKYEGKKGIGSLILIKKEFQGKQYKKIDFIIKFENPIPFHEYRWSRKVLELASSENKLITNYTKIFGLGHVSTGVNPWESQNIFQIDFLDRDHWRLSCGNEVLLISKDGVPSLKQKIFDNNKHLDTYRQLFPQSSNEDTERFAELLKTAASQRHGSMLVVDKDAKSEADRLQAEGTRIETVELTPDLYRQVSSIDGAVIIDPCCKCYAIGVILDGQSRSRCKRSRGARYNSAIRYVYSPGKQRLAVVVSDDQTIDIISLPPSIKRSELEKQISKLEQSTYENYHPPLNWLSENRFYIDEEQCERINESLKRIEEELMNVRKIRENLTQFSQDPDFDESYYKSEDPD